MTYPTKSKEGRVEVDYAAYNHVLTHYVSGEAVAVTRITDERLEKERRAMEMDREYGTGCRHFGDWVLDMLEWTKLDTETEALPQ